jgi:DNA-binding XRE family transcriptional regulator
LSKTLYGPTGASPYSHSGGRCQQESPFQPNSELETIATSLRRAAGLSQTRLARAAGVTVRALRNWEQGRGRMLATAAFRLARALGCSADALFGLTPPDQVRRPQVPGKG